MPAKRNRNLDVDCLQRRIKIFLDIKQKIFFFVEDKINVWHCDRSSPPFQECNLPCHRILMSLLSMWTFFTKQTVFIQHKATNFALILATIYSNRSLMLPLDHLPQQKP